VNGYNRDGQQRITESIHPTLKISDHINANTPMHVTNLGTYDLILGYTYLRNHGIVIDPAIGKVWFRPNWCQHAGAPAARKNQPAVEPELPTESAPPAQMKILRRGKIPYTVADTEPQPFLHSADICAISARSFRNKYRRAPRANIFAIIFQDIEEHRAKSLRPEIDPMKLLPKKYQEYADVFSKAASDELPPHRSYDHFI
jgi:hypothetical protein